MDINIKKPTPLLLAVAFACLLHVASASPTNVVIILADDLGFSDLGCYGGEINTPNLDGLAETGLRFSQFYNTGRCWPTRGALMTGFYAQQIRRDTMAGVTPSGNRGQRPAWAPLLPELLKQKGYRSYHSGKWHIDGMPTDNGFDHSYYLKDQGRFFNPQKHYSDDEPLPPVEKGTGYYATTAIADHAIKCLQEHAAKYAAQPFFHYIAFTSPHFPLHARQEDIERYRKMYRAGWDAVRQSRFQRLEKMGMVAGGLSEVERDVGPPYHFPEAFEILGDGEVNRPLPWKDLTEEQCEFQADKMAIHAAMIDCMDREIGRVLDQFRKMDVLENTLVFFLSDNGASAEIMVRADGHDPQALPGSAASYLCLGPGWSNTANTPFRRHKTWNHEGGIATPFIVHWPEGIAETGVLRHNPGHVVDLFPTVLDVAGVEPSSHWKNQSVPPAPGKSLLPVFSTDGTVGHDSLWWMHEGNRALRIGNWKLVAAGDEAAWELYDLGTDRTEMKNLAAAMPEKVREMEKIWAGQLAAYKEKALQDLPKK